jgi:hypothetical protein
MTTTFQEDKYNLDLITFQRQDHYVTAGFRGKTEAEMTSSSQLPFQLTSLRFVKQPSFTFGGSVPGSKRVASRRHGLPQLL